MPGPLLRPEPLSDPLGIVRAQAQSGDKILDNEHKALPDKVSFKWLLIVPATVVLTLLTAGLFVGFHEEQSDPIIILLCGLAGVLAGGVIDLIRLVVYRKHHPKSVTRE